MLKPIDKFIRNTSRGENFLSLTRCLKMPSMYRLVYLVYKNDHILKADVAPVCRIDRQLHRFQILFDEKANLYSICSCIACDISISHFVNY